MIFPAVQSVVNIGPVSIHWYGLLVVAGIVAGYLVIRYLLPHTGYHIPVTILNDLLFHLIIWSFVGARLYHVLNEPAYYWNHPVDVFKIWNGGLAIHGALLVGIIVVFLFSRSLSRRSDEVLKSYQVSGIRYQVKGELVSHLHNTQFVIPNTKSIGYVKQFFSISDILVIGLALGQSIGRWGNYFNQELFGKPTNGFFKVFIDAANRPVGFENIVYYHPTFFYESVLNLTLFIVLFLLFRKLYIVKTEKKWLVASDQWLENQSNQKLLTTHYSLLTCLYLVGYGLIRFFVDFLRIDPRPFFTGLYLSQWVSLVMIVIGVWIWYNGFRNSRI